MAFLVPVSQPIRPAIFPHLNYVLYAPATHRRLDRQLGSSVANRERPSPSIGIGLLPSSARPAMACPRLGAKPKPWPDAVATISPCGDETLSMMQVWSGATSM